jgi:hypothetical protein
MKIEIGSGLRNSCQPFPVILLTLVIIAVPVPRAILGDSMTIPLPEHPRPDLQRADWLNLNGYWDFCFDPHDRGLEEKWYETANHFTERVLVPFSWGAPLSGVGDDADIAWYARSIEIPNSWAGKRLFLVVGASDWETQVWLNGRGLGIHRGGYTPFEFELPSQAAPGKDHLLVVRVDDAPREFKLEGKQGYGPARGIWQTPYLEARGSSCIDFVHFTPDINKEKVNVRVGLLEPASQNLTLHAEVDPVEAPAISSDLLIPRDVSETEFEIPISNPRLWSLKDPFLYHATIAITGSGLEEDRVHSYFGMREIAVLPIPGHDYPYIALNGEPIYLQMALDQAYHPEGYYTFPSDQFMRDEILRSLQLGLNGIRIHVKVGIPRKLYWADRLGLLVMADVPNSWGKPDENMREETLTALKGMIKRDYNHPSIFSWVLFNETWGLRFEEQGYTPEVQQWVASMYELAKELDPSRLVEDNSANRQDHVVTDINSWHVYLPGTRWREHLDEVSSRTFPGSNWNFVEGRRQQSQPLLNSECGNVWGYEGSTGDVDWSWDYHIMINEFRRKPKIAGWLYTEHHDVINEWNGYFRYDRSPKYTGFSEFVDGMSIRDLHAPVYLSTGDQLCREVRPGSVVEVPLWISVLCSDSQVAGELSLKARFWGWNQLGQKRLLSETRRPVSVLPWMSEEIDPLRLEMPTEPMLAILSLWLEDSLGCPLHRNFTTFLVADRFSSRDEIQSINGAEVRYLRFAPNTFSDTSWSEKHWQVLNGLKVNGAGHGFFEYRIPWPESLRLEDIKEAVLCMELSAKQLLAKDLLPGGELEGDYMRGGGVDDRTLNPNSYPMTDDDRYASTVRLRINGDSIGVAYLEDDPADHRGVLSWHSQLGDRRLREAGSYGYLTRFGMNRKVLERSSSTGEIIIRLEVDSSSSGGVAVYGERFGRYPFDPTLALVLSQ